MRTYAKPWPDRVWAADLLVELAEPGDHVRRELGAIPADLLVEDAEVWTTVKLMRRVGLARAEGVADDAEDAQPIPPSSMTHHL